MRNVDSDFFASPPPRAIAHRGASGAFPENTMAAFRGAHQMGARYIELDVHMTRDGIVVVAHDDDLTRTCGIAGRIAELDYAEVARADAGFAHSIDACEFPFRGRGLSPPTLASVLTAFRDVCFVIEIKQTQPSLVGPMLRVIEGARMRRQVLVASEHQAPLDEVRKLWPGVPTGFSAAEVANFFRALVTKEKAYRPPADALQIPPSYGATCLVAAESMAAAHRAGIELHVWTVNEEAEMRAMLALGVDGILSDYPDRLLEVMRARF